MIRIAMIERDVEPAGRLDQSDRISANWGCDVIRYRNATTEAANWCRVFHDIEREPARTGWPRRSSESQTCTRCRGQSETVA